MYKVIYYNIRRKDNKIHQVRFNDLELAEIQYDILKEKYQYCGIIHKGKQLVGNLFIINR